MNSSSGKRERHLGLGCKAVLELIEKQKIQEPRLSERCVVFMHCVDCDTCRDIQRKVLTELIDKMDEEELKRGGRIEEK